MIRTLLLIFSILLFAGCGSTPGHNQKNSSSSNPIVKTTQSPDDSNDSNKQLILYIHGYNQKGATKQQVYGEIQEDNLTTNIAHFAQYEVLQSFDQQDFHYAVTTTTYYGNTPPHYYSPQDIDEIDEVTQQYGGGIPRYATIIAKFIKHVLQQTKCNKITIISASMGSLVTRWMIEKNVENLAQEHRIAKWLSINGVVRGNYLASQSDLAKIVNTIQPQPVDVKHMSYQWIERNLHSPKSIATSPYYQYIQIGFVSSTQAGAPFGTFMKNKPNDGYQQLRDTYFADVLPAVRYQQQPPTHTIFHQSHIGIKDYPGAWAQITTFLSSTKRVRITLHDVTLKNLHEKKLPFQNRPTAEVVFASSITSDVIKTKWHIDTAISQRTLNGGSLPVHYYTKTDIPLHFSQILFDDFIDQNETVLDLTITGYELDDAIKYNIYEALLHGGNDPLGQVHILLPVKSITRSVVADEWQGYVTLEVIHYK